MWFEVVYMTSLVGTQQMPVIKERNWSITSRKTGEAAQSKSDFDVNVGKNIII